MEIHLKKVYWHTVGLRSWCVVKLLSVLGYVGVREGHDGPIVGCVHMS